MEGEACDGVSSWTVRWLNFGPYPSVCVCTVAAAIPLLSVPTAFLSHMVSQIRK